MAPRQTHRAVFSFVSSIPSLSSNIIYRTQETGHLSIRSAAIFLSLIFSPPPPGLQSVHSSSSRTSRCVCVCEGYATQTFVATVCCVLAPELFSGGKGYVLRFSLFYVRSLYNSALLTKPDTYVTGFLHTHT